MTDEKKFFAFISYKREDEAWAKWVNREIETFIEQGRTDKIIPFIVEGTAFSNDPARECFP